VQLLQQRPPNLYFVEHGTVTFEALDHANAPSMALPSVLHAALKAYYRLPMDKHVQLVLEGSTNVKRHP
jgi:hypothetical protein